VQLAGEASSSDDAILGEAILCKAILCEAMDPDAMVGRGPVSAAAERSRCTAGG
jgi:hypothetical protein